MQLAVGVRPFLPALPGAPRDEPSLLIVSEGRFQAELLVGVVQEIGPEAHATGHH